MISPLRLKENFFKLKKKNLLNQINKNALKFCFELN